MEVVKVKITDLVFDPNNARKHSQKNLDSIKGSLTKFGQQKPIVVNKKNIIIAGNGTVGAAKELGWTEVSAVVSELDDFMQSAYALADNRTAELAEWDAEVLKESLAALDLGGFEVNDIGFTSDDFDFLKDGAAGSELSSSYTSKIEAPIYVPTGPKPDVKELFDAEKYEALCAEIDASENISRDEKTFLKIAAGRHIVFDYQTIAEYYAHAPAETQELMEKSALVIIDFESAIENGFVKMSKDFTIAFDEEGSGDSDDE